MSFKLPEYLVRYLNEAKYKKPFESYVNNSTFYAQLNYQWMNYMQNVVRPCIAYGTGSVDGWEGLSLSTSTGMALVKGATRLVVGDKFFFEGNDETTRFFSDVWSPSVNFRRFVARAYSFMFQGGTAVLKLNMDEIGRCKPSVFRIDRTMISTNEEGEVTQAIFFVSLLSKMQSDVEDTYWLVEERGYDEQGKYICYRVHVKSGVENSPVLPDSTLNGIPYEHLPGDVQSELKKLGVTRLNEKIILPMRDGLGVWLMSRTASNSSIPDSALGDPLLYGVLDLLWSIDVVFSGSLVDVLNGESKILVPKQFLQETMAMLRRNLGGDISITTEELRGYHDDTFVYVQPSNFDKDKMSPMQVQFEIRADSYAKMMELYERAAAVRAGYSPTSIFPYLTPDNSAKTATEITAEENLTHASVKDTHCLTLPVFNRLLREVAKHEGYATDIELKLSDYVGNKLQQDSNIRENFVAGLIPKEYAVQQINNLSVSETQEYLSKLDSDEQYRSEQTEQQYAEYLDEYSQQTAELPGDSFGRGGNGDQEGGQG